MVGLKDISKRLASIVAALMLVFAPIAGAVALAGMMPSEIAYADATGNREDYADQFLDGSPKWNESVLRDYDRGGNVSLRKDKDATAESFVDAVESLVSTLFGTLLGFAIVLSVARMVGRAILEMLDITDMSALPKGFALFFFTAAEREKAKTTLQKPSMSSWLFPMMLETGKFLAISFLSLFILFVIVRIVSTVFSQIG